MAQRFALSLTAGPQVPQRWEERAATVNFVSLKSARFVSLESAPRSSGGGRFY
jgi:hypothetical protein